MSDDDTMVGTWHEANKGITLPNSSKATHNINLSPLFLDKIGFAIRGSTNGWIYIVDSRGADGYYWSSTRRSSSASYYASFNGLTVSPTTDAGSFSSYSLRCLVFTNNG